MVIGLHGAKLLHRCSKLKTLTWSFFYPKICVIYILFAADIHYMLRYRTCCVHWRNLDVFGIQSLQAVEAISLGSQVTLLFLSVIWLVYIDFSGIRILYFDILHIISIFWICKLCKCKYSRICIYDYSNSWIHLMQGYSAIFFTSISYCSRAHPEVPKPSIKSRPKSPTCLFI